MEIVLLGSGSTGNCALIRAGRGSDEVVVALDCGLALRTARGLAAGAGFDLAALDAVILTHRHSDHSANVVPLAARARAPLFAHPDSLEASPRTCEAERRRRGIEDRPFATGRSFQIGALSCLPVRLEHDAEPTHGFVFEAGGVRAGFFTDLGNGDALRAGLLEGLDLLVLEFNHDSELLRCGPYPPFLQARVGGESGHLSNCQAAGVLEERGPAGLRGLVLAHLSQKNNDPALALASAAAALRRRGLAGVEPVAAPARGALRLAPDGAPAR